MSPLDNSSPGQASSPVTVMDELKRQAERKAVLKMFYSAADAFREYKGPFANETAAEREKLAAEYEQRGRTAERERWGDGSSATPTEPAKPSPRPAPVAVPRSQPKVEVSSARIVRQDESPRKPAQPVQVQGGQIIFSCRWCSESISVDTSQAGKLAPCPKCDLLVSVPKPAA